MQSRSPNIKLTVIRVLLILILLADMIFIFYNSAQNAVDSSATSQGVTEQMAPIVVPDYDKLDEEKKKEAVLSLDVIVREAAHLLQFVPLGFACYLLLQTFKIPKRLRYLNYAIPPTFGLLYALSDEIHQIFSPGRFFDVFDLFMDMMGVLLGLLGAIILMLIINKVKSRSQ